MSSPFALRLLNWFDQNAADLPWRKESDPYPIWLSEIMLQQTRIETVIPYYHRFLDQYSTVHTLANAPLDAVLKLWEGLGYYSRLRNLHKTAQIISSDFGGQFPRRAADLQKLPGIGPYTAGAIASIAFNEAVPVLDGNIIRVFSRLLDLDADITQTRVKTQLWQQAADWMVKDRPGDYNQALMELGQTTCLPRDPHCSECPIRAFCRAYHKGTQHERPVKKKKPQTPHYDVAAGIIYNDAGQILIAQRPPEGLLGGMWEFPGGKQQEGETLPECLQRELCEELAIEVVVGELFVKVRHAFTHFKITLYAFECHFQGACSPHTEPQALEVQDWAWVTEAELLTYSFGKADRQVIEALKTRRQMLL